MAFHIEVAKSSQELPDTFSDMDDVPEKKQRCCQCKTVDMASAAVIEIRRRIHKGILIFWPIKYCDRIKKMGNDTQRCMAQL